jgi:PAS domain S-box-containing protein
MTPAAPVPILIVDDNAQKRLALKAVLLPLGCSIVEADSGLAALRCVMAQDFAVILLDIRMPLMDGFETATLIRQRRQSEMTPIIFITASGRDEIANDESYPGSAVGFMSSSVAPDELRAQVAAFGSLFTKAEVLATQAREVQASADQLRLLTDAAPVGIFQTDANNRYVYTNPRWSEITGISAEAAAGQPWQTTMGAERRAVTEHAFAGLDRSELSRRFEINVPGAATRIVLVTSKAIPDHDGGVTGWVGTLADVTAEVGAESAMADARDEANEASRLKSDFLANMSHEIRTPMNGVIGMTDLLLETDLDARQRDYAQTVRNSGEALLTIINGILDFSKVEAGKLEIEDIAYRLPAMVDDISDLLAGPAQAKGLELIAVIERAVPTLVRGDPGRVRQVLTNLIANAIKFTQAGEVVVRASATEDTGGDTLLRFEVSDTGDGIHPDKLRLIFEPFAQADTSTSRKYGGTGLGLAISRQLIALMGGDCGVSSELGVGSTFWFTIRTQCAPGHAVRDIAATEPDLTGVAALIVDDSATQRALISDYLTDWGMTVTTADSAQTALTLLRTAALHGRPFAVGVLDQAMPGMDGLQLATAIQADPELDAGLVLMTGFGKEGALADLSAAGVDAAVSKPIHRDALRASLWVALGLTAADASTADVKVRPAASGADMGRVLLAEDNLINQKVAMAMLSGAGYRVDTVANGAAAVRALVARPYDAVLMDCQMPEMNGYEATAAIRDHEGTGHHTPIIAMTAGARIEDRERCIAEGMDSYLAKPVSKDALLALVGQFVHKTVPEQTLDEAVFGELSMIGEAADGAFVEGIVAEFFTDTRACFADARGALGDGDRVEAARIAHRIRGSSAQLGGERLASACRRLERTLEGGSWSDAETAMCDVESHYEELCSALTQKLALAGRHA